MRRLSDDKGWPVRWERLFEDLEAEFDAAEAAELEAQIADRTRFERSRLRLVDRLRGSVGRSIGIRVQGAGQLTGELRAVGVDWLLVRPADRADRLVRTAAVLEVVGLAASSSAAGEEGLVAARFTLSAVLRGIARDRTVVTLTLIDSSGWTGLIEIAAADLIEVSERRHDEPGFGSPSETAVRRCVPLTALSVVREH